MVMTMIYFLPMLLGRTFDVKHNRVGVDIYNQEVVDNPGIIHENGYHSEYRRVRDLNDVQNLLKVSGELSLNVKSGMVKIGGSGSYLRENEYRGDMVEILTVMSFETVSQYLPKTASPIPGWKNFPSQDLGTHYVSSVTYGGELLASLKFRAVDEKYVESIKASIDGALQVGSAFDLEAVGKLDKLQKDLHGQASLEITYYATVPLRGVAQNMDGLRSLVNGFQDHVKEVNGGLGVPIRVELTELSFLDNDFLFNRNGALQTKLKVVEIQFNDLLQSESTVKGWLKKHGSFLTEDQETRVDAFYREILTAITIFKEDINNLDIEKGPEQLERSLKTYKRGGSSVPGKYRRKWEALQKSLDVPVPKRQDGNSVYVRWGRTTCNGTNVETISNGYMAAATDLASPSNTMCLPETPHFVDSKTQTKSRIAGVRYGAIHLNPFNGSPNLFDDTVKCSICYVPGRNTLVELPKKQCPEGWHTEYSGYYLAGRKEAPKSEAVCIDSSPEASEALKNADKIEQYIAAVTYEKKVVPCVVCSK